MSLHLDANRNVTRDFAALMVRLASAYPTTGKLTEDTIRTYARILGDVPLRQLAEACSRCVRETKFFPSSAEILSYVAPSADDAASLAWTAFRKAAEDVGAYASVEVEDPAAAEALLAVFGSWAAYCAADEGPAMHARRQEFAACYRQARRQARPAVGATRLPGLCEGLGRYLGGATAVVGRLAANGDVVVTPDAWQPKLLTEQAAQEAK